MKPYFQEDGITIFNARWEDVWFFLGIAHNDVALCWADPPYGVKSVEQRGGLTKRGGLVARRLYAPVVGDDGAVDPAPLCLFPRSIIWGANNFSGLAPSQSWFVWDKKGMEWDCTPGDAELAWTNLGGVVRVARIPWFGGFRDKAQEGYVHPTQKPVALATWGFQRAKLKRGDLVFSPYMGSGPEARAAMDMGLRFIGCEIVKEYCDAAVNRLRQRVLL